MIEQTALAALLGAAVSRVPGVLELFPVADQSRAGSEPGGDTEEAALRFKIAVSTCRPIPETLADAVSALIDTAREQAPGNPFAGVDLLVSEIQPSCSGAGCSVCAEQGEPAQHAG